MSIFWHNELIVKEAKAVIKLLLFVSRILAEEELQTNIAEMETFTLPSGQEIEKEDILFYWYL